MSQQELLKRLVEVLDGAGVDYMLTGSLASSLQGDPRATHDIDLVVALPPSAVPTLVKEFGPPRYYLDEQAALQAISRQSMFNLLDIDNGDKVDFWLLTNDEFDRSRFSRKAVEDIGFKIKVSKAEDTILMKLKWSKDSGGSEKQFQDARSVYELQFPTLDQQYLDSWAGRLGVEDLLTRLRTEAKIV